MEFKISKKYPHLEVSRWGDVRRVRDGFYFKLKKPTKAGYWRITGIENGKRYNVFIHSLVAEMWVSGYQEGLVVNHKDGNKLNNAADNLEWITQAENVLHGQLNDLTVSKYGIEKIKEICEELCKGKRVIDIARTLDVPDYLVKDIKGGKWKNISGNYDIPKPKEKPTDEAIHWVCSCIAKGMKNSEIERTCPYPNVSRATVSGVKNKLYYLDISNQYF